MNTQGNVKLDWTLSGLQKKRKYVVIFCVQVQDRLVEGHVSYLSFRPCLKSEKYIDPSIFVTHSRNFGWKVLRAARPFCSKGNGWGDILGIFPPFPLLVVLQTCPGQLQENHDGVVVVVAGQNFGTPGGGGRRQNGLTGRRGGGG